MPTARAKIQLDIGRHATPNSGLFVSAANIVRELSCSLDASTELTVRAIGPQELIDYIREILRGSRIPVGTELLLGQQSRRKIGLISDLLRAPMGYSIVHGTANSVPLRGRGLRILTIHDLLQAYPPLPALNLYVRVRTLWYRLLLSLLVRRVDVVIAINHHVAAEIRRRFRNVRRLEVIYSPLDQSYIKASMPDADIQASDVLAFASLDPRKNLELAMRAFVRVCAQGPWRLIVLINAPELAPQITDMAQRYGIAGRVEIISSVAQSEMPALYSRMRAVLFPSLAEGFGYPLYEALSQGVPVVCDRDLPIPEIAKSKFLFGCDVRNPESVAGALADLLKLDFKRESRCDIAQLVRDVVAPQRTASKLLALYGEVLRGVK